MSGRPLARDALWEQAADQHGFFTINQARDLGVTAAALKQLAARGTVTREAFGVFRFPKWPVSRYDPFMLAVLWTRADEAVLSHETALDAHDISDINPTRIHVTVAKHRRVRRTGPIPYELHYEDLQADQIGWWHQIPTVNVPTAIAQCIEFGTPTYLLRQAIERGQAAGRLRSDDANVLAERLEHRHER